MLESVPSGLSALGIAMAIAFLAGAVWFVTSRHKKKVEDYLDRKSEEISNKVDEIKTKIEEKI